MRLIFPATPALAGRIDEAWHHLKLRSRSEAIRALIERGLSDLGMAILDEGAPE